MRQSRVKRVKPFQEAVLMWLRGPMCFVPHYQLVADGGSVFIKGNGGRPPERHTSAAASIPLHFRLWHWHLHLYPANYVPHSSFKTQSRMKASNLAASSTTLPYFNCLHTHPQLSLTPHNPSLLFNWAVRQVWLVAVVSITYLYFKDPGLSKMRHP